MTAIPQQLQDAFQAAFDAANLVGTLMAQYTSTQVQQAALIDQIRAAGADRDAKEQYVVSLTAQLLGMNAVPPAIPSNGPLP